MAQSRADLADSGRPRGISRRSAQPLGYILNLKLADPASAEAFANRFTASGSYTNNTGNPFLIPWQDISQQDGLLIRSEQKILLVGSWLLALLAIGSPSRPRRRPDGRTTPAGRPLEGGRCHTGPGGQRAPRRVPCPGTRGGGSWPRGRTAGRATAHQSRHGASRHRRCSAAHRLHRRERGGRGIGGRHSGDVLPGSPRRTHQHGRRPRRRGLPAAAPGLADPALGEPARALPARGPGGGPTAPPRRPLLAQHRGHCQRDRGPAVRSRHIGHLPIRSVLGVGQPQSLRRGLRVKDHARGPGAVDRHDHARRPGCRECRLHHPGDGAGLQAYLGRDTRPRRHPPAGHRRTVGGAGAARARGRHRGHTRRFRSLRRREPRREREPAAGLVADRRGGSGPCSSWRGSPPSPPASAPGAR